MAEDAKTPGNDVKASNAAADIGVVARRTRGNFSLSLTVRTVECNSYRVTQTRATRSPRPGTETGGRDDHVVDCDREPGDARVRRSYQEPLRRNVERRSQELALFTRS